MKLLLNSKSFWKKSTFSNKKCPVIPEDLFKKTFVSNSMTFKGCIASQTYLDIKPFLIARPSYFQQSFFSSKNNFLLKTRHSSLLAKKRCFERRTLFRIRNHTFFSKEKIFLQTFFFIDMHLSTDISFFQKYSLKWLSLFSNRNCHFKELLVKGRSCWKKKCLFWKGHCYLKETLLYKNKWFSSKDLPF